MYKTILFLVASSGLGPAICDIVGDVKRGVGVGVISARFHNTIAAVIV